MGKLGRVIYSLQKSLNLRSYLKLKTDLLVLAVFLLVFVLLQAAEEWTV